MTSFALELKSIQEELNLSENAANQAMNECPGTNDTDLDIYQQNVVDSVSDKLMNSRLAALGDLNRLDSTRNLILKEVEGFSLNQLVESVRNKIIRLKAQGHEVLNNAKQEESAAKRDYNYFIAKNKLKREASYPDSLIFHWAFIILAVLIESVVNSFFFANASDLGLLGGLFQALFISLSNIGSALLIGIYVLPFKNHVDSKKQLRAKIAIVFYIIFSFIFNLGAAHYRTLLEENSFTATANTIPHLIHDPFGINFEAWNLLIIGLLFMAVALIKGYKSDDVYPGFGQVHRKWKNTSNHSGKRIEMMKSINNVIDEHSRQAAGLVKNAKQNIVNYKDTIFQSEEIISKFAKFVESSQNVCNNALWEYRNTNVRVRTSKPPAYFSKKHAFNNYLLQSDFSEEKTTLNKLKVDFHKIQNEEEAKFADGLRKLNENALEDVKQFFVNAA